MNRLAKTRWQRWGLAAAMVASGLTTIGLIGGKAQGNTPYGLKAGKPYNGTEVKFLICCLGAGQFAQLSKMTGPGGEFEQTYWHHRQMGKHAIRRPAKEDFDRGDHRNHLRCRRLGGCLGRGVQVLHGTTKRPHQGRQY